MLTDKDALKEAAMSKAGKRYECAGDQHKKRNTSKLYIYDDWIIMRLIWNSTGYWPWETDVNKAGEYRRKHMVKNSCAKFVEWLTDATRKEGMYNEQAPTVQELNILIEYTNQKD